MLLGGERKGNTLVAVGEGREDRGKVSRKFLCSLGKKDSLTWWYQGEGDAYYPGHPFPDSIPAGYPEIAA